ncbi:MAG: hypothetical protein AAFO91_16485, partial [Bacteroidota bacterium]
QCLRILRYFYEHQNMPKTCLGESLEPLEAWLYETYGTTIFSIILIAGKIQVCEKATDNSPEARQATRLGDRSVQMNSFCWTCGMSRVRISLLLPWVKVSNGLCVYLLINFIQT